MTNTCARTLTTTTALTCALMLPALAQAREVNITTTLKSYGGDGAYLAVYLTNDHNGYEGTLWLAGGKAKYYKHLSDWFGATYGDQAEIDGITGASVGQGRTLTVTVEIADAMIDAGYQIRVDAAVEDMRDSPAEIIVPLTAAAAGKPVSGTGYVDTFQFDM